VMKAGKWDRHYPLPARLTERLAARS
jgi:hypothetical protein